MRHAREALQSRGFVLHLDVDDIGQLDIGALARIMRTAEHAVADEPVGRHAELG
jgi:hypothetical protein